MNTKINLCDTCEHEFSTCISDRVAFGDGNGNDNIIACSGYKERSNNEVGYVWLVYCTIQDGYNVYQHFDSVWDNLEQASLRANKLKNAKPLVGSKDAQIVIVYTIRSELNVPPSQELEVVK